MKIEFILKDRFGNDLNEGDKVLWICPDLPVEQCTFFGGINKMYNSGEEIHGKLVFFRTKEQVKKESESRLKGKKPLICCPSETANNTLMFMSDDGEIQWVIQCLSESDELKHPRLIKIEGDM